MLPDSQCLLFGLHWFGDHTVQGKNIPVTSPAAQHLQWSVQMATSLCLFEPLYSDAQDVIGATDKASDMNVWHPHIVQHMLLASWRWGCDRFYVVQHPRLEPTTSLSAPIKQPA